MSILDEENIEIAPLLVSRTFNSVFLGQGIKLTFLSQVNSIIFENRVYQNLLKIFI